MENMKVMNPEEMANVSGGLKNATKYYLYTLLNEEEKKEFDESGKSDLWLLANYKEQVAEGRGGVYSFEWAEKMLIDYLGRPAD